MISYDEIFKILIKAYFEKFATVVTDYEIVNLPKKADVLIVELKEKFENKLTLFKYFKKYNGIEFKSFVDPFKMNEDEYRLGIYINGILLQEKEANKENSTFTLVSSRKPQKLFDDYKDNLKKIENGHYILESMGIIPIHILVIKELDLKNTEEIKLLKEFSVGEDRSQFIRLLVNNLKESRQEDFLQYALLMYEEEIFKIFNEEGLEMTVLEKNLNRLNKIFGYDKKLKEEGEYNKAIETAKNLLKENISIDIIGRVTGLKKDEIEKIKINLNANQ